MNPFYATMTSFLYHRELIWQMAMKDLRGRNKGAILGLLWVIINPLIQTSVYVVVITFVFKIKGAQGDGPFEYVLYVLSGMIPWQILMKGLQEAPTHIRTHKDLVTQVIYPIEILPMTVLVNSIAASMVVFALLILFSIIAGAFNITILLFPLPLFFMIMFILGVSWTFAVIGAFIKDLPEMVSVVLGLLMYSSPVFINQRMVGERMWALIKLNPLSHFVICFRDVCWAQFHPMSWITVICCSIVAYIIGAMIITKAKLHVNEYI